MKDLTDIFCEAGCPNLVEREHPMPVPTDHNKIFFRKRIRVFNAIGPYLRELQCQPEYFFFDCFTVCVDITAEPETRQFFGWWMEMTVTDDVCEYDYHFGLYNDKGIWQQKRIPAKFKQQVSNSLTKFYEKLSPCLQDKLALPIKPSPVLAKSLILSAA